MHDELGFPSYVNMRKLVVLRARETKRRRNSEGMMESEYLGDRSLLLLLLLRVGEVIEFYPLLWHSLSEK
jgi:hypothetical protein